MLLMSFNVENLFARPRALNQATWAAGRPILEAYEALSVLFEKSRYSDADKRRMIELLDRLGLSRSDSSQWALLRRSRGSLVKRPTSGPVITATGRGDWIGWLELKTEAVTEQAIRNTAEVIHRRKPDVLAVVEAENRITLKRFNDDVLAIAGDRQSRWSFDQVMVIDGNDDRGIDVGVCTRGGHELVSIVSHVDDTDAKGVVFSRDCPEYMVRTPAGAEVLVLVNHFKSKGYGKPAVSDARRRRQAARVAEIYQQRRSEGIEFIAVVGDLNDTPESAPLAPLTQDTDLIEVAALDEFDDGGFAGTYGKHQKIDYVLLSPALAATATAAGYDREGVWGGARGDWWSHLPTITRAQDAASDHAAVWVDLDI